MSTIYFSDGNLQIRSMEADDSKVFYETYLSYGWHPSLDVYQNYFREQSEGTRTVLIAVCDGKVAGLCTLIKTHRKAPGPTEEFPSSWTFPCSRPSKTAASEINFWTW